MKLLRLLVLGVGILLSPVASYAATINVGDAILSGFMGATPPFNGPWNWVSISGINFNTSPPEGAVFEITVSNALHTETVYTPPAPAGLVGLGIGFSWPEFSAATIPLTSIVITYFSGGAPFDLGFGGDARFTFEQPSTVPLPAALPLFATGLAGIGALAWRRRRRIA